MIRIHKDVLKAVSEGKPIVALESTIISHGMPYPKNIETANKCEAIIESQGVKAATIAIIDGQIVVGLTPEELELDGEYIEVFEKWGNNYVSIPHKTNNSSLFW